MEDFNWIMFKQEATFAQHAMPQKIHMRKKLSQKSSPWTFECESVLQFDSYSLKENRSFCKTSVSNVFVAE